MIRIEISEVPDRPAECKRCVNTPTRTNRPAYGETCRTCGVTNERKPRLPECKPGCRGECQVKSPKFEPAPELAVKVHLFRMVARKLHRAQGHPGSFMECYGDDCPLWRAVVGNAKPLR